MQAGSLDEFPPLRPRPPGAPKALEGIRVIDFAHFIAGAYATTLLADLGADVIKVEAPGRGDEFRYYPPVPPEWPDSGAPYLWTNRNKRSIAIDLKTEQGLELARALIACADVVVENFSTGVMARFGLDYEACRRIKPDLVYCSVSAYGREGEFADRLGFDPIAQAESGFLSMNGYPDRQGVRTLSPIMDISTATMASHAILGALFARERSGEGQLVEVALFDHAVLMNGYATYQHLLSGRETQRHGNVSPDTCPSGVFMSQDKPFYINIGNDRIFHRLAAQVLESESMSSDPVLATRNGRMGRRDELFARLNERFAAHPWSYWQPRMRAAAIPCGEVRTVGAALRSPEARARELMTRIPHPRGGWVPNLASSARYSGTPVVDATAAPTLGEHTDEVLAGVLGLDAERIAALHGSGAVA
ncbi:CoA transferase [Verticiella sediminum]|uniref:CoA transferase n=1 Tax=Verticiella sediminum TaxID=1247510 RepID=A0A556AJI9_9BURK|nr:CoA transferase [Verticiella sediminum]TSH93062.1 CoA transferase [Verticiella sediminum]